MQRLAASWRLHLAPRSGVEPSRAASGSPDDRFVRTGLDRAGKTGRQEAMGCPVASRQTPGLGPITAEPAPDVTALFNSSHGWTGGDAAYSVPVSRHRSLWFFGDSFIGDVVNGQRSFAGAVHNADAVQQDHQPLQFGWRPPLNPEFQPPPGESGFYWPGYGICADHHVYLFTKRIEDAPGPPGFNFQWSASDLVEIGNPQEPSSQWHYRTTPVPGTPEQGLFGTAGVRHGPWLYVYGITNGQAQVARTHVSRLPDVDLSYWNGQTWSSHPEEAAPLFDRAATEMSVCQVPGRRGYYAVYTQGGMGADIAVRHADHPWGPWSDARIAYHCPETGVYVYAAKAHPELSQQDGTLVVTYCCNPPDFQQNVTDPSLYRPHGVRLHLPPC